MKHSSPSPGLPSCSPSSTSKEWKRIRAWEESGSAAWRLWHRGLSTGLARSGRRGPQPPAPCYQFWSSIQAARHCRTAMGSAAPA